MTAIRIDYAGRKIVLSSAFEKKAFVPGTNEFAKFMSVRNEFPDFSIVTRQFKKNTKQEHYRGLTYDFMRDYITTHEKDPKPVLDELEEKIDISKCHSLGYRYPTVKAWFLARYPEIAEFGMSSPKAAAQNTEEAAAQQPDDSNSGKITALHPSDEAEQEAEPRKAG